MVSGRDEEKQHDASCKCPQWKRQHALATQLKRIRAGQARGPRRGLALIMQRGADWKMRGSDAWCDDFTLQDTVHIFKANLEAQTHAAWRASTA